MRRKPRQRRPSKAQKALHQSVIRRLHAKIRLLEAEKDFYISEVEQLLAGELKNILMTRRIIDAHTMDPVTGLYSRLSFDSALSRVQEDQSVAVVLFDLNHFKLVNETLGHVEGDAWLMQAGDAIKDAAEAFGVSAREVFRYGGDEMVVLCPADIAIGIMILAESNFGVRPLEGKDVELVGGLGPSKESADKDLYARKAARKRA